MDQIPPLVLERILKSCPLTVIFPLIETHHRLRQMLFQYGEGYLLRTYFFESLGYRKAGRRHPDYLPWHSTARLLKRNGNLRAAIFLYYQSDFKCPDSDFRPHIQFLEPFLLRREPEAFAQAYRITQSHPIRTLSAYLGAYLGHLLCCSYLLNFSNGVEYSLHGYDWLRYLASQGTVESKRITQLRERMILYRFPFSDDSDYRPRKGKRPKYSAEQKEYNRELIRRPIPTERPPMLLVPRSHLTNEEDKYQDKIVATSESGIEWIRPPDDITDCIQILVQRLRHYGETRWY